MAQPAQATLANGVMAHAFELDNVRQPGAGVHPGATAFVPAFAMAEEKQVDGRSLLIKRLHLGKAAEGGVTAALLASRGFAGPETVLEGKFGFCQTYSDAPKLSYLTYRLGREFESMNICIKRCACHINAHAPIEALQKLRQQINFDPEDVQEIIIGGIEKLITHHAIYQPKDLMMAQYSIPFCVALSLYFDPTDPESFDEKKLKDKKILAMMRKVRLKVDHEIEQKGWDRAARVTVGLGKKQRHSALVVQFKGTPKNPTSPLEVEDKARAIAPVNSAPIASPRHFGRGPSKVAPKALSSRLSAPAIAR